MYSVCDENIGETPITCSADCSGSFCGDGTCDSGENALSCSQDCTFSQPDPDPGAPTPSCKDVVIHAGEETACSIKVENVETFPLTTVTATVTIPHNIQKTDSTDTWTCSSTMTGVQCDKTYNPYLVMGEIEYIELTFTSDVESKNALSTSIVGAGESARMVSYNSSQEVTIIGPPITADAVNDMSMGPGEVALADNDTLCSSGTTTFAYHDVVAGVTIDSFNSNTGTVVYSFDGGAVAGLILYYDILCNGAVTDTAGLSYMMS